MELAGRDSLGFSLLGRSGLFGNFIPC
jgi:hypothetical protein